MIVYPEIDPVAVSIGPLVIRWYSLAYVVGLLAGWRYVARLERIAPPAFATRVQLDDFIVWVLMGIVLGGRIGYVLFYNFDQYLAQPLDALKIWQGGMSFHGGLAGVLIASALYCRRHGLSFLAVMDVAACATPIGLGLGRVANFINHELYGRVTDVPWAVFFPHTGVEQLRHPSQIYEALTEGVLLFILLFVLVRIPGVKARRGLLGGVFLCGYWLARSVIEQFREPDSQLGFVIGSFTMGQVLSLPMLIAGGALIWRARTRPPAA